MFNEVLNKVFLFLIVAYSANSFGQTLLVNELQALNSSTVSDAFNEFDDWIELFNSSDSAINLCGLYISDDPDNVFKWQLPLNPDSTTLADSTFIIPAKAYRLLWADEQPEQGFTHLGFKLSDSGEELIISHGDSGKVYDHILFGQQYTDISWGRDPADSVAWYYFSEPSPLFANSGVRFTEKSSSPQINISSGFYSSSVEVTMHTEDPESVILYTLNSSIPTEAKAFIYDGPFEISSTTVLRAVSKKRGLLNSSPVTRSIIFTVPPLLPVIFLTTDSVNLWGSSGIFYNRYNDFEKPVHFEFYDHNTGGNFESDAGVKIHAPDGKAQQSLRLYARSSYGNDFFEYPFFSQKPINKFKRLILRNAGNDGAQINNRSHLRDLITQQLYFERNANNAISAFEPVNVYINGGYWGIYNLRERQDIYYIQQNYPYQGEIDLLERAFNASGNRHTLSGNWQEYDAMRDFLTSNDMSIDTTYSQARQMIDVNNFMEYWIFEIFIGNFDWLLNNIRFWKEKNSMGRWRWILWDTDHGLGLPYGSYSDPEWNTLSWSTATNGERTGGGYNTIIIRSLLDNKSFKNDFINLFADLLNTSFKPENIYRVVDALSARIEPDIVKHFQKWPGNNYQNWQAALQEIKDYVTERPAFVRSHIQEKFSLSGYYNLNLALNNPDHGCIKVNTITVSDTLWQGIYFYDNPVTIISVPDKGYAFDFWIKDSLQIFDDSLIINDFCSVKAFFKVDSTPEVIISEINYHSSDSLDSGDWIELYNPKLYDLNISGWRVRDDEDEHEFVIPDNTLIESQSYLVLSMDRDKFVKSYPDVDDILTGFDFALNNSNDHVRIYNAGNILIDSVSYTDVYPWPVSADGMGNTLELKNVELDNALPENWDASYVKGGTPGQQNSLVAGLQQEQSAELHFELWQNYPNPFNATTRFEFYIPYKAMVEISVFNIQGQLVQNLIKSEFEKGRYNYSWNAKGVSSGVYFIRQKANDSAKIIKSLLIK